MAPSKKRSTTKSESAKKSPAPAHVQSQTPREKDFPIVGIGASAGGLEAFTTFLKNLPNDTGMAFVIVSHQDPLHESNLTGLLKKVSSMPTMTVEDNVIIQPNHVYVIPPNRDMTISAGRLRLEARQKTRIHLPIDNFFQSLAIHCKNRAIGVVLSGTASDGTIGLKAIKATNGITFAQDEASAKFSGMPRHAVDSNVVDFILPPDKIAKEIARIAAHPLVNRTIVETETPPEPGPALNRIFAMLRKESGVDFSYYKQTTVLRRIQRRMLLHRRESLEAYAEFLSENPKQLETLYEDILISVTSFFRDPEIFETLKTQIFPKLLKSAGKTAEQSLRIWVPGCSSGEEPYSIAIALQEFLNAERLTKGVGIQIFATDVSETAIDYARSGLYPNSISADVSPERLNRFFIKVDQGFQIQKSIRDQCVFARHNVAKDAPFSKIDLLSCRNLLIYLGPVLQRKIMPIFHYALNPNGYLLLGSSESIGGFSDYFFPADKKYKIYSRKTVPTRLHFDQLEPYSIQRLISPETLNHKTEVASERDVMREGDRLLLSRYAPASVILNESFDILQFRGRTGMFLEPGSGQASLNIMKMAREGVVGQLHEGLLKAKKERVPVVKKGLPLQINGQKRTFTMEIAPFTMTSSRQCFYLVLFQLDGDEIGKKGKKPAKAASLSVQTHNEMVRLQTELSAMKAYLQSIIEEQESTNEELRAANEEILSSNEELQSTNEEMETAKEELQSANEELTTLNEELQVRNAELNYLNNDLNNLLGSVYIPILMLGRDLRIRRFTPMAERVLNLIPSDVGRLITDINLNITVSDLAALILGVIDTMMIKELEVHDKAGSLYHLQIRPYKTTDNKIDGAVLVLIDIESLKKTADAKAGRSYLEAIIEELQEPLIVLEERFQVKMVNDVFLQKFQLERMSLNGNSFFQLSNGLWNIPQLKTLLKTIVSDGTDSLSTTIQHPLANIGQKKLRVKIRRLKEEDGQYLLLLSMVET